MHWMRNRLEKSSASKGSQIHGARSALNRPEITQHSQAIAKYVGENFREKYIIPPFTLNIQQKVYLHTLDTSSEFYPGYLVIPATTRLAITDGQHRTSGIAMALAQLSEDDAAELGSNAIAVMITCESDRDQVHQDFADCSKTKPLPASLLALYDRRNLANRLFIDLETNCRIFAGRIDSTSKTLSKKSTLLFLANQLRQLVKELLAGSYAMPDVDLEKRSIERLGSDSRYEAALTQYAEYVNHLTDVIPVWKEIAGLPVDTLEASRLPSFRAQGWVCLTATGLNLIGRVGHSIFTHGEKNWRQYADRLGQLDWRREAPIWEGNIIQGTRLLTAQGPVKNAFVAVCREIGWAPGVPPANGQ
jgi:DGQHR domain-containing protein